jgi:hypothetical protein
VGPPQAAHLFLQRALLSLQLPELARTLPQRRKLCSQLGAQRLRLSLLRIDGRKLGAQAGRIGGQRPRPRRRSGRGRGALQLSSRGAHRDGVRLVKDRGDCGGARRDVRRQQGGRALGVCGRLREGGVLAMRWQTAAMAVTE